MDIRTSKTKIPAIILAAICFVMTLYGGVTTEALAGVDGTHVNKSRRSTLHPGHEQLKELRISAKRGDAKAQIELGVKYAFGKGVPQNLAKAVQLWRRAAEQGNANAEGLLGLFYKWGKGVSQDFGKAAKWFRKSAKQQNDQSAYQLGILYYHGKGVPQNYDKAAKWLRLAADQGYVPALSKLAFFYAKGLGVPQNYVVAYVLANVAAAKGSAGAMIRESSSQHLSSHQIETAQDLSIIIFRSGDLDAIDQYLERLDVFDQFLGAH